MNREADNRLVQALQQPSFYDHPVEQVELIETHISWVFLAGDFAYKVKKPVDFGFLDFSTLAKRRHYCHEELRLNRRFAPQLYLEVKTIGGDPESPTLGGQPPREYAVKMKRFAQQAQLDNFLAAGLLTTRQIEHFATYIAKLHQAAPVAGPSQPFGSPQLISAPAEENFTQIRPLLPVTEREQLNRMENWCRKSGKELDSILRQRKAEGFIRECHGDVHLANMAWFAEQPTLFDCIEFNENLRWIDVINDIAFLVMDLDDRGQAKLGWRFLNRYLQETGDYQGLQLLNYYKVYRAMVRAKVICLRLAQAGLSDAERRQDLKLYHSYLDLAASYIEPRPTTLLITHGLSGSGKSTFARDLADISGAIHLSSDRERKRLHGLAATADSHSPLAGGIYSVHAHTETYERLRNLARQVLCAGYQVIVDATFLQKQQRDLLRQLAAKQQVPMVILNFSVSEDELRRRIQQRSATGGDQSEATLEVLAQQLSQLQPFTQEEQQQAITVSAAATPADIAAQIRERVGRCCKSR